MALLGAYHSATGAAVKLSTLLPSVLRQLDVMSNPGNAATVYLGPSTVLTDGTNAWISLSPGQSWGTKGDQLSLELDKVYVIGTASDKVHLSYVS